MSAANPHAALRRVEELAGLGRPTVTPPSNGHSLAFRVISRILSMHVDDRHSWNAIEVDLHSEPVDSAADVQFLKGFPTAADDLDRKLATLREAGLDKSLIPPYLWAITRDFEIVAIVDCDGFVHDRTGLVELMRIYEDSDREITTTTAIVLTTVRQASKP